MTDSQASKDAGTSPLKKGRRGSVVVTLTLAVVGLALLTLAAAGIAYQGMSRIQHGYNEAAKTGHKLRAEGTRLVQHSQILAVIARRIVTASSGVDLVRKKGITGRQLEELKQALDSLVAIDLPHDQLEKLQTHHADFVENVDHLVGLKLRRIAAESERDERIEQLEESFASATRLHQTLLEATPTLNADQVKMTYLRAFYFIDRVNALLFQAAIVETSAELRAIQQLIEANFQAGQPILSNLPKTEVGHAIANISNFLEDEYSDLEGLLATKAELIRVDQRIRAVLLRNDNLVKRFTAAVSELSDSIESHIERERIAIQRRTTTDRLVLIGVVLAAAIGSILIFAYVSGVMRRLSRLRRAMTAHAERTEVEIPRDGNDEISDMGDALAFFVSEISRLALTDGLTGLANRLTFTRRFDQAVSMARRQKHRFALAMIDLDKFKPVNDTYGHPVGDAVLQTVAKRLQECCRETDVVARLGGDEFAIILTILEAGNTAETPAKRIVEKIAEPIQVDNLEVQIGTSVGIAYFPTDGEEMAELVRRADLALYEAKRAGRNAFRVFETTME